MGRGGVTAQQRKEGHKRNISCFSFLFLNNSKKSYSSLSGEGLKARVRDCAAMSAGNSQEWHEAPAKRSNIIMAIRGSEREGLELEGGAAIVNFGGSEGGGRSLQVLGGTWEELAKEMRG